MSQERADLVPVHGGLAEPVDRVVPLKDMAPGIAMRVRTPDRAVAVHLGPEWYLTRQDRWPRIGDRVEIAGAAAMVRGRPVLIATKVAWGRGVLELRDRKGHPAWCSWKQRRARAKAKTP